MALLTRSSLRSLPRLPFAAPATRRRAAARRPGGCAPGSSPGGRARGRGAPARARARTCPRRGGSPRILRLQDRGRPAPRSRGSRAARPRAAARTAAPRRGGARRRPRRPGCGRRSAHRAAWGYGDRCAQTHVRPVYYCANTVNVRPRAVKGRRDSFAHHLDDHALLALAVPFAVEHPLPGAAVERAAGNGDDHLVPDRQAAQMGRGIVLPRLVVAVEPGGPPGKGPFAPLP